MLKKSVTYEDFNGNKVTEEFAFHLSKADLIEMEAERRGGLAAYLQHIVDSNDGAAIIEAFKDLLLRSIGRVSEDGRRFEKSAEIQDDFMQSPAYSEMFMELATGAEEAAEFVNGIIPQGLADDVAGIGAVAAGPQKERAAAEQIPAVKEKVLTKAEVEKMDMPEVVAKVQDGWKIEK